MKVPYLPAVRWFRGARQGLPPPRFAEQPMRERCREVLLDEVQVYAAFISRASRRRE